MLLDCINRMKSEVCFSSVYETHEGDIKVRIILHDGRKVIEASRNGKKWIEIYPEISESELEDIIEFLDMQWHQNSSSLLEEMQFIAL